MKIMFENTDAVKVMVFLEDGILAHVVNDAGVMGAGIAAAIREQWPVVNEEYEKTTRENDELGGMVLFSPVNPRLCVANMYAQHGFRSSNNSIPLDYAWLQICLTKLFSFAIEQDLNIHLPRIGAGLAGGDWDKIWAMVVETGQKLNFEGNLVLHRFDPPVFKFKNQVKEWNEKE